MRILLILCQIFNILSLNILNQDLEQKIQKLPRLLPLPKKTNIFENKQSKKDDFAHEKDNDYNKRIKELELTNMKKENEIEELILDIQKNKKLSFYNSHFEINNEKSVPKLEKIEDIRIGEDNKYAKVLMKKICLLKEKINENTKSENIQQITNEFEIMNMLHHTNVLKAENKIINEKNLPPSIVLEYCPIDLEEAIKKKILSIVQQIYTIYQIAEGMKYIHSRRIIHQNLNPKNILISSNGIIKIFGFDNSQIIQNNDEYQKQLADISSFGDIVYFILSGGETTNIKNTTSLNAFSLLSQQLIDACWCEQPESKPTFKIICDILTKYQFKLNSLTQQETQEITQMITQYKIQIEI